MQGLRLFLGLVSRRWRKNHRGNRQRLGTERANGVGGQSVLVVWVILGPCLLVRVDKHLLCKRESGVP